jgi:outer membrane protein
VIECLGALHLLCRNALARTFLCRFAVGEVASAPGRKGEGDGEVAGVDPAGPVGRPARDAQIEPLGEGEVSVTNEKTFRSALLYGCVAWGSSFCAVAPTAAGAQQVAAELSLQNAIALAKGANGAFLSTQNDQAAADWQVREAYGQFLPSVDANLTGAWQQAGAQRFGTIVFQDQITDWYFSSYGVQLGMTINGSTIFGIPNARASRRATQAEISAAEFQLESTVAFQYMAVLRARDGVAVAQRRLERARQNLEIVRTRVATGAAAGTEGRQADVDLVRAEVALIQAEAQLSQARLLLGEQIGVGVDESTALLSAFEVFEPSFELDRLLDMAMSAHPSLTAFRARESAARASARQASTSQYLPSLRLSAGFSGQAQEALNRDYVLGQAEDRAQSRVDVCEFNNTLHNGLNGGLPGYTIQDCSVYALDDAGRAAALSANDVFPFDFTSIPARVSATLSIPIFTGFSRERQVSQARNAAEDAEYGRRAEELRLRTAVSGAYENVRSAYRLVEAEARNLELSEEQLELQQRRYALGAADLLLLMDAQTGLSTAEQGYLNAVYDFHYNLIALEAAVGRPLRPS